MTAEIPIVDPVVRRSLGAISRGADDFALARVMRSAALVVGIASAAVGVQAFVHALAAPQSSPPWRLVFYIVVFVPLALMVAACLAGRLIRPACALFAATFAAVLVCWPVATAARPVSVDEQPAIWYLLNVATAAAVLAFPMPAQIAFAIGIPMLYVIGRTVQLGAPPGEIVFVVLDGVFAMIFAGVVLTIGWMLRTVSASIDRARARAVTSYADAAAADAAERERIAIAALMHDSVLAALIAAERADSDRERTLAVAMAREALTRLANADRESGEGPDAPLTAEEICDAVDAAAREQHADVTATRVIAPAAPAVPGRVARAIALAAGQAIANAVEHAGGAGLVVAVHAERTGIEVRVSDRGPGFDLGEVPADRLGIRGSIRARMAAVAGAAEIVSGASGTTVTLTWEHER